ncbi:DNA ligase [Caligus rogercresseyi]|uniref:DNA ligase n=2 Tax=Caligus rogercresseyi TaxID=217165 RepID=A0A7T8HHQ9_CALRO|nr:DNA ligase [Caligus rogercresseyi]
MSHKVAIFKEPIPKAFPDGSDLILDAEVLMVDNKTGDPLPFGSLGVHKGSGFKDATPCLFIFDCIYYNGENLMSKPIWERRKLLTEHMVEVGNFIKFSEMKVIKKKSELGEMIQDVLKKGLEGLVLKDINSTYEPGKRHWLKVKKDYLNDGAMADTADLVVLGGWFGTGQKGGILSIFLMGCFDSKSKKWVTVTKVHGGFDDATLEGLQDKLVPKMRKIKGDYDSLPTWLLCNRGVVPDFVVKDPKVMPVWEITGAEFSKAESHTASGISIRFPRVTKQRKDKNWETATNLIELIELYKASKERVDFQVDFKEEENQEDSEQEDNISEM